MRRIRALWERLAGSGAGIFFSALTVGLVLGSGSLISLELLSERREAPLGEPQPAASVAPAETSETVRSETTSPEATRAEPAEKNGRERPRPEPERPSDVEAPDARELEARLRSISSGYPGEYGLVVRQPSTGTTVALRDAQSFRAASLAKLPVLLALYRDASEGRLSLNEEIVMRREDIQPGTGVLQYRPPGTTMTLRECARYLVRHSDNTAWSMLEDRMGEKRVESELASVGARSTRYEYARHTTTPADTLKLLQKISDPAYTTPEHSRQMLAMMSGTAFENRLPQGLPADARISHKIGTLGTSFSDAGIVFPPEDERAAGPFYVVVLSDDTSEAAARSAMREISLAAYRSLVDPEARSRSMPDLPAREEQVRRDQPA